MEAALCPTIGKAACPKFGDAPAPKVWGGARVQQLGDAVLKIWARPAQLLETPFPKFGRGVKSLKMQTLSQKSNFAQKLGKLCQNVGTTTRGVVPNFGRGASPNFGHEGLPKFWARGAPQLLGGAACANSESCHLTKSWKCRLVHISGIACPRFESTSLLDVQIFTMRHSSNRHLSAICIWSSAWI